MAHLLGSINTESLNDILDGIRTGLPSMAAESKKVVPELIIEDHGIRYIKEIVPVLKSTFMHLVRNSMDHGIELPEKRIEKGKNPQGSIRISAELKDNNVLFRISDDGAGLNLSRQCKKAVEIGSISNSLELTLENAADMILKRKADCGPVWVEEIHSLH